MRWRHVLATSLLVSALCVPLAATPAYAADATGCSGSAMSWSDRGLALDKVSAPGAGGTEAQPFEIMWKGRVEWEGQTDQVIQNGSWKVNLENLPFFVKVPLGLAGFEGLSGDIANEKGDVAQSGTFVPSDKVPVMIPGTFHVTFEATGQSGASCSGDVWVKVVDEPKNSPLFWASLVLILIALIMFALAGYTKIFGPIFSRKGP